jgi:hypothetical protein
MKRDPVAAAEKRVEVALEMLHLLFPEATKTAKRGSGQLKLANEMVLL